MHKNRFGVEDNMSDMFGLLDEDVQVGVARLVLDRRSLCALQDGEE